MEDKKLSANLELKKELVESIKNQILRGENKEEVADRNKKGVCYPSFNLFQ